MFFLGEKLVTVTVNNSYFIESFTSSFFFPDCLVVTILYEIRNDKINLKYIWNNLTAMNLETKSSRKI